MNFWIKLTQKGYFQTKKNYHRILHTEINLYIEILIFGTNFRKKVYFRSNIQKMNITIKFYISKFSA